MKLLFILPLIFSLNFQSIDSDINSNQLKNQSTKIITKSDWDKSSRKRFMSMCMKEFIPVIGKRESKKVCTCSLKKLEIRFSSYYVADTDGNQDIIADLIKSCL